MRPSLPLKPPPGGSGKAGRETLLMHGEGRLARSLGDLVASRPRSFSPAAVSSPAATHPARSQEETPPPRSTGNSRPVRNNTGSLCAASHWLPVTRLCRAPPIGAGRRNVETFVSFLALVPFFLQWGRRARAADGVRVVARSRQQPRFPPDPGITASPAGPLPPAADPDALSPSQ